MRLPRLQQLEDEFKRNDERIHADAVAIAIEHVQTAMDALDVSARD